MKRHEATLPELVREAVTFLRGPEPDGRNYSVNQVRELIADLREYGGLSAGMLREFPAARPTPEEWDRIERAARLADALQAELDAGFDRLLRDLRVEPARVRVEPMRSLRRSRRSRRSDAEA